GTRSVPATVYESGNQQRAVVCCRLRQLRGIIPLTVNPWTREVATMIVLPLDRFTAEQELTLLRPLARQFPNLDAALAELARLSAERILPKGVIHVISDIHGDDTKLRHVINNASGTLRPLIEQLFGPSLEPAELQELI